MRVEKCGIWVSRNISRNINCFGIRHDAKTNIFEKYYFNL